MHGRIRNPSLSVVLIYFHTSAGWTVNTEWPTRNRTECLHQAKLGSQEQLTAQVTEHRIQMSEPEATRDFPFFSSHNRDDEAEDQRGQVICQDHTASMWLKWDIKAGMSNSKLSFEYITQLFQNDHTVVLRTS